MYHDKSPIARVEWLLETNGDPQAPVGATIGGIPLGTAILGGSALTGVSSLVGGKKQAGAATQAAQIQAQAAMAAANLQQQRFEQVAGTLQPYIGYGQQFLSPLSNLLGVGGGAGGVLNAPLSPSMAQWSPTMDQLANMPGYQFQLQQALKAGQAAIAPTQGGRGGPSLYTAENIASGLAASNWQQNWAQFQGQQQLNLQRQAQLYNMLSGQAGVGLSAAGALGGVSTQTAQSIGNALQAAGAAQASGVTGAATALTGGLTGATSALAAAPQNLLFGSLLASQLQQGQTSADLASAFNPTGLGGTSTGFGGLGAAFQGAV